MSEEISKEDILNVTGNMFDTFLDYVDNSNNELEQLQQENNQLKDRINKAVENIEQLGHSEWVTFGRSILLDLLKGDKE